MREIFFVQLAQPDLPSQRNADWMPLSHRNADWMPILSLRSLEKKSRVLGYDHYKE